MNTITVRMTPDETTPRGSRGCNWIAECVVNGQHFTAQSRNGASCALARQLVAAGIPDAPMTVEEPGGKFTWRSLHEAAGRTYSEGEGRLHQARFVEFNSDAFARGKEAGLASEAVLVPAGA